MRRFFIILAVCVGACKTGSKQECVATPKDDPRFVCTAGTNVFCRCEDLRIGTKECGCDQTSFATECRCTGAAPSSEQNIKSDDPDPPITRPPNQPLPTGPVATTNAVPEPDLTQTCPGAPVAVDALYTTLIEGDTSHSQANNASMTGACAVATGKEQIFDMIPTATGKLTVVMHGAGTLDPTLYIREADCATGAQRACAESTGIAEDETARINVVTGRHYFVFADSKANSAGPYTLEVSIEPGSFCGDGKVNDQEACDDGNKTPADGCGNDCKPDGATATAAQCPGQDVHLWTGTGLTINATTTGFTSHSTASTCETSVGADRIYAVTVHASGTMTAKLTTSWDGVLYARRNSCSGLEVQCTDDYQGGSETVGFGVTTGSTYWIVVDGAYATDIGNFELKLSLQ